MTSTFLIRSGLIIAAALVLTLRSAGVQSDTVFFAGNPPAISQVPLYIRDTVPPLNMLVMGKDHKIYYEAYNDASDLDADGIVDVGYRGWERKNPVPAEGSKFKIDYYGYFNSYVCYDWDGDKFVPARHTDDKTCNGNWSGDFLNYATMSRMDVLRRVLYGGWRRTDTAEQTVLQGAFFPQDAHSWGKEYQSIARDGYDIRKYTAIGSLPAQGRYHLFAVTTFSGNFASFPNYDAPRFRVLRDTTHRIWNWVAMEGPVAGNRCGTQGTLCVTGSTTAHPGHPSNRAEFDALETTWGVADNLLRQDKPSNIECGSNCGASGQNDNYMTVITGRIRIPNGTAQYRISVDGDDAVDFEIRHSNGVVVATAGKYGAGGRCNCDSNNTGILSLVGGQTYTIKFRHEEGTGADNYVLRYQTAPGNSNNWGDWTVVPGSSSGGVFDLQRSVYSLVKESGGSFDSDRFVRVQACPATESLRDASCKTYPSGSHKPTGILHEYGENQRMYFGLVTGTQRNNLQGGVLRRNIDNFANEIDASTGVFRTDVNGIVKSIDRLRMIGGGYAGGGDNTSSQKNWNWANRENNLGGNCVSQGGRTLANGECRMWGNPIAEMMFEAVRYFAGASEPTATFISTANTYGKQEDDHLALPEPAWKDPYKSVQNGGGGYASCSRPVMTVISDINPSYDGNLPGSAFETVASDSTLGDFNAASLGQAIWTDEFGGGSRNVFIGQVGANTDWAPTAKSASSFGNIRGLAPEEPSKEGTYYSASVARYAASRRLNSLSNAPYLTTYSVALASPLPRMLIPVGDRTVELLPFAQTVSGTFGENARKPTNTIVDFFVESISNFPGQPLQATVNQGRAHAVFRINYEDVEQGNDHDMDAIVRYEISAGTNSVTVKLRSEYAAGSANQNIGYVISGTTKDGVYLEVRDTDSQKSTSVYGLNTPSMTTPIRWAGECVGQTGSAPCSQGLDFESSRVFTVGSAGIGQQLRDPLWYAAKYGTPGRVAVGSDGEPENYFLVSNPLNLRAQLSKAFDSAQNASPPAGSSNISGARIGASSFTLVPSFQRNREAKDWTGNLTAISFRADGTLGSTLWNAQAGIPGYATRGSHIFTTHTLTSTSKTVSRLRELPGNNDDRLRRLGINPAQVATRYGANYNSDQIISYLEGDQSRENGRGGTLRNRSHVLGSIINSEPVAVSPRANYGYSLYSDAMFADYTEYLTAKRTADRSTVFVGANDGMLHAFNAKTQPCAADPEQACAGPSAGNELFAYIPHGVLGGLGELPLPDDLYNHRYYVDGQIAVSDARHSSGWKTLLAGTTGAGGRSLFVLDVTNPQSFGTGDVLWERNSTIDYDIGHIFGKPMIVPLENGSWGVVVGNGYGGINSDPSLYILDAFTGELIRKITANDGNPATAPGTPLENWICRFFGGVAPSLCARSEAPYNGMAQVTAIDKNGNGRVDTVYGGDLQGNIWKFDLGSSNDWDWAVANSGTPLFVAEKDSIRQPITGGIRVAAGPGTGVMVYFGTGRYVFTVDNTVPPTPDVHSLYGIFDNGTAVSGGRGALERQAITGESTSTDGQLIRSLSRNMVSYFGGGARRGWYIDLAVNVGTAAAPSYRGVGERFIGTPLIQSGRVFFTTYTPMEDSCNPGGLNFVYGLDLLSGAGGLSNIGTLPGGNAICTGADCAVGAVSIDNNDGGPGSEDPSRARPPVTSMGLGNIDTLKEITSAHCTPGVDCPTFEECSVVIYPGGFVLPRPCGRQSWRQLK
ncbi:hypothetical protein E5843_10855 [Luteimonas yindakuii]|uniref:PilC/PilY family type IV pilus protein n=1 Tax=Luteimonas yindakuii TaxID=2565782 RepID=UPI00110791B5|nr:PilC/PilY family type IV pilus protein [Luteimonas yindakuii]QCO68130.2 hypothetical protein E5843_10855 [Luteimonas yindakuii]